MAWNDPSPRAHAQSSTPRAMPANPGYEQPVSFPGLLFRLLLACLAGGIGFVVAKALVGAWHEGHGGGASGLDAVLALAVAAIVAVLAFRWLLNRPAARGLSARVRDGGGWFSRNRSWDDGYGGSDDGYGNYGNGYTLGEQVVAEAVVDVVSVAIDIATDL
jgi:hypothetical protein